MAVNGYHHKDMFPKEIYDNYTCAANTLIYSELIHAITTLSDDGTIKIEGAKSGFMFGVDRAVVGVSLCDRDGRLSTADVISAELNVKIK